MKKYLGSTITAFSAAILPFIIILSLLFGISALCSEISIATLFIFLSCVFCVSIWIIYLKQIGIQLYTWGYFHNSYVQIKTFFTKPYELKYDSCSVCGIGYYTHGVLNSQVGTKIYFIFLSCDPFHEKYRSNINLWKPTKTQIKIRFSEKLYSYLISVLPKKQARMLISDYEKYYKGKKMKTGDNPLS